MWGQGHICRGTGLKGFDGSGTYAIGGDGCYRDFTCGTLVQECCWVSLVIGGFNNSSITGTRGLFGMTGVVVRSCGGNGSIIIIMSTRNSAASSLVTGTLRVGPSNTSGHRVSVLLSTNRRVSVSLLTVTVRELNYPIASLLN